MKAILIIQPKGSNYVCFAQKYDSIEDAKRAAEEDADAEHPLDWPAGFWDGQMAIDVIEGEEPPGMAVTYTYTIVRKTFEE